MANAPEIAVAYVSIVPEIQGFARQLREQIVGPAGDAGADAGEAAGGGLKDKLKLGAAAAGLAAGALVAKGLADAIDQANVTSKLQAQLGASGKDAAKYGKVAGKLYAQGVTEDFQTAADAIKSVMQSGIAPPGATNKQLQAIATKASDVAGTFDQDLGGVTNAVSQMMRTGLAKNSGEAFDIITKGFQGGADKAGDLLDTFNEYGGQFQKLGLDGTTALGLIQQGIKGGARDADIAADAMKEFSIRSIDGSTGTAAGFKALGLNADDMAKKIGKGGKSAAGALDVTLDRLRGMKDPVKQSAAATALFGTQAEDLGKALFSMDPSKATDAVGKVGGAADKMGKTLRSGPSHELQVFTRTMQQGLVTVLGTYVVPAISGVGHAINTYFLPAVRGGVSFVQEWSPYLAGLAVLIGGITLAVKAAAIQTAIFNGVTKVTTFFTNAWAVAQGILNAVMALNPFVLVAIALAALVAGIIVAYNKSETFRNIVQAAFKAVGNAGLWLWNNAIKPAFKFIGDIVVWLWQKIVKPYIQFIMDVFKALGQAAKWLYDKGIKPAFDWIADKGKWLWNKALKPAFDSVKKGVSLVGDAFGTAKDAIGKAWGKVESIAKKPIGFIINTVYNKGIVGVWNKVATAFGADPLKEFHPKGFATGGILPGYTPGRDVHLAALSGGEAVMRPEWTRAMGPGYVNSMNALARKGGVGAIQKAMGGGLPAFKDGGIFGWISSAGSAIKGVGSDAWNGIKKGASWLKDTLESSARAGVNNVVNPLLDKIPGLNTGWGKSVKRIPSKVVDSLFGYAKKADGKMVPNVNYKPGAGVAQWKSVVLKALQMVGQPSNLLNTVLRRMNQESGGNPKAINNWDINAKNGTPSKGLMQVIDPTFNAYAGKLRSKGVWDPLANVYSSMRYAMSRYGSLPAAYDRSGGYDSGGWLQPGATLSVNESGKPEPVLTSGQWSIMSTLAARGAEGNTGGGIADGTRLVLVTEGGSFEAYVNQRADERIKSGLTGPAALGRTL